MQCNGNIKKLMRLLSDDGAVEPQNVLEDEYRNGKEGILNFKKEYEQIQNEEEIIVRRIPLNRIVEGVFSRRLG
jgi:hypothetical protein